MTPSELREKLQAVVDEINSASGIAGAIAPPLRPYIAIGKVVDQMIPGLVAGIDGWIQGNPLAPEEKLALAQQLAVLSNPDLP